jgi:hypothetical protein
MPSSTRWSATCPGVREALLVMKAIRVPARRAAAMLSAAWSTAWPST